MARVDLTIMGAGVLGLSLAHVAASRGARVRVIEAERIGAGASGGLVGALSPHTPDGWNAKKAFQLGALIAAADFWSGVEARGGLSSGFARVGRLQSVLDERELALARAREAGARAHWGDAAHWRVLPATGAGWEPASPTGFLIHDTLSGRIAPRMALAALAASLRAMGGVIKEGAGSPEGAVVWATGAAGLADLGAALGRKIGDGVKGQAAALALSLPDAPQIYHDGLHIVPHANGTVAIGSTNETTWDDPAATDHQIEALITRARQALPALAAAPVVETWAGIRPRAKSRAPLLGPWPGRAGHFVLNGGFKIGFGMAPALAEVMADLVLEGKDRIPEGFRL